MPQLAPRPQPSPEEKVVFQLSLYSNLLRSASPLVDLEAELLERIRHYLSVNKKFIGNWEVVWGPRVKRSTPTRANPVYMARSLENPSRYVVATAGTGDALEEGVENFAVSSQVAWPFAPGAKISLGTSIGLANLLSGKPGGTRPGANKTLVEFLSGLPDKGIELVVTGHSLGGTLSGTLALWLKNIQDLWDPAGEAKVSAMTTAGLTAGNSTFATHSDQELKMATTRWANTLDLVPLAWNLKTLERMKTLYSPHIEESRTFSNIVDLFLRLAARGDYLQIQLDAPPIRGQINVDIIDPDAGPLANRAQSTYQHITAYVDFFNIPGVVTPPLPGLQGPLVLAVLAENQDGALPSADDPSEIAAMVAAAEGSLHDLLPI